MRYENWQAKCRMTCNTGFKIDCSSSCKSAIWWCNLTVPDRLDTTALATHKPQTQSCTPQSVYTLAAECTLPPRLTYNTRYPKAYCWHSCKWTCLLLPNKLLEPNAPQILPWASTVSNSSSSKSDEVVSLGLLNRLLYIDPSTKALFLCPRAPVSPPQASLLMHLTRLKCITSSKKKWNAQN